MSISIKATVEYDLVIPDDGMREYWAILKTKGIDDIKIFSFHSYEDAEERAILALKKRLSLPSPKEIEITL